MAAPRQGLPVRLERAPHRGAAFALSNASKRARIRSIGLRSRGSLFIFRSSPAVAPLGESRKWDPDPGILPRSLVARSNEQFRAAHKYLKGPGSRNPTQIPGRRLA